MIINKRNHFTSYEIRYIWHQSLLIQNGKYRDFSVNKEQIIKFIKFIYINRTILLVGEIDLNFLYVILYYLFQIFINYFDEHKKESNIMRGAEESQQQLDLTFQLMEYLIKYQNYQLKMLLNYNGLGLGGLSQHSDFDLDEKKNKKKKKSKLIY